MNPQKVKYGQYSDQYSMEIQSDYQCDQSTEKSKEYFIAEHSDLLSLNMINNDKKKSYDLQAKKTIREDEIILQVRGKITTQAKLKQFLQKNKSFERKDILLWVNKQKGILLRPTNITKYLFQNLTETSQSENCYIENHFDSKILLKAGTIIVRDEKLSLSWKNVEPFIYKYE